VNDEGSRARRGQGGCFLEFGKLASLYGNSRLCSRYPRLLSERGTGADWDKNSEPFHLGTFFTKKGACKENALSVFKRPKDGCANKTGYSFFLLKKLPLVLAWGIP